MGKLQNTEFPNRSSRVQSVGSFRMLETEAEEGVCIVGLLASFSSQRAGLERQALIRRLGNIHCFLQPDQ
jgi:hypothetical protein